MHCHQNIIRQLYGIQSPDNPNRSSGWLGWVMVLGSFQCLGVLLLLHIVGQGPAVLAAGAGRLGYIYIYIFFFFFSSIIPF